MPAILISQGTSFLRRCFLEAWDITRLDITEHSIARRGNLVMFDGDRICAWLGIEEDGELTNACVERGYGWRAALKPLILKAFELDVKREAFGFVPTERLASAYIFISLGMVLPAGKPLCIKRITYPERSIELVKLIRPDHAATESRSMESPNVRFRNLMQRLADLHPPGYAVRR